MSYIECGILRGGCSVTPTGYGIDPESPNGLITVAPLYLGGSQNSASPAATSAQPEPLFVGHVNINNNQQGGVFIPEYATPANMVNIAIQRRERYQYETEATLAIPAGYTLSDLTIRIDDLNSQWRLSSGQYRYRGGIIYLDLQITVYVTDQAREKQRCRDLIMEHEMLHVNDEREIIMTALPERLLTHPAIMSDFRAPINERDFNSRIRGSGDGRGSLLEQSIQRIVWVYMSSNKAAELHGAHPQHGVDVGACLQAS